MTTVDPRWQQIIEKAVTERPDAMLDVTVELWVRLASELIVIIGDGGFRSLYMRSVHLTRGSFPWLANSHVSPETNTLFLNLKTSMETQDFDEASKASIALLSTFIDILTLLIGQPMTIGILSSAWGDGPLNIADKELR